MFLSVTQTVAELLVGPHPCKVKVACPEVRGQANRQVKVGSDRRLQCGDPVDDQYSSIGVVFGSAEMIRAKYNYFSLHNKQ